MPRRRILFFTGTFCPHSETFIYEDIKGLAEQHEVRVLTLERANMDKFPFDEDLIRVLPYSRGPWLKRKILNRLYAWQLYTSHYNQAIHKLLKEELSHFQPDIIHSFFGTMSLLLHDNLSKPTPPLVSSFLGFDASRQIKKSKTYTSKIRKLLNQPYVFPTANAQSLLDYLNKAGASSPYQRYIPLGVDTDFFQPLAPPPPASPRKFIQVARLADKKGHRFTFLAFKRLKVLHPDWNWSLKLVGDGELRGQLEEQVQQLGLGDNIEFLGWKSPAEVRSLLEASHCFLQHSITPDSGDKEGIPAAIKEAMAMALPVISTYHSGIPELVRDGENGRLIAEGDIEQYTLALKEAFHWKLFPQNRHEIVSGFSLRQRIERLSDFYDYAIEQTSSSPH